MTNKKTFFLSTLVLAGLLASCSILDPDDQIQLPEDEVNLVTVGDSLTMGIQDAGLTRSHQLNTYGSLVARQIPEAADFVQPLIREPGVGVPPYRAPLELTDGGITPTYWQSPPTVNDVLTYVLPLLENYSYPDRYNNLGVNGAKTRDIRSTTGSADSEGNYFFDIVLRNIDTGVPTHPNFRGETVMDQVRARDPDIVLLWIGNNDFLGAALAGGDPSRLTLELELEAEYNAILQDLAGVTSKIVIANIMENLPFVSTLDGIFIGPDNGPVLFNPRTLQPVNMGTDEAPLYIPLKYTEAGAAHLLLSAAVTCRETGLGVPTDEELAALGLTAEQIETVRLLFSGTSSRGSAFLPEHTLTDGEYTTILEAIQAFNTFLANLAIPMVDAKTLFSPAGLAELGYSAGYVIPDTGTTVFSLDGVHLNDLGHALAANAFIDVLNAGYGYTIPRLDVSAYAGQYTRALAD